MNGALGFLIRDAILPQDEIAVAELWKECNLVAPYADPISDLRFACSNPSSTVLVGVEGDTIVGTVMTGHDGHRGWLYYVATSPQRRHSGIARQLISAAEEWLQMQKIPKVMLLVREGNAKVTDFYSRLGFEVTPRVTMSKWINGNQDRPV
jgi:ribosomal protein S18 acetylase RimI-like enzyme